jgi:hypothetical protein
MVAAVSLLCIQQLARLAFPDDRLQSMTSMSCGSTTVVVKVSGVIVLPISDQFYSFINDMQYPKCSGNSSVDSHHVDLIKLADLAGLSVKPQILRLVLCGP